MNLDATLAGGRRRASLPLAAALAFVALAPASCADGGSPTAAPAGSSLRVEVAPLSLPGVADARYTLTVANSSGTVWSRTVTSSAYGDGAGALSYVGPCEAGLPHTVTLDLEALFDTSGAEIPASSWHDPTPISRPAPCAPNADTPVTFDLTIARAASQGFFDVAIQLDDIFCSAKLDCVTGSPGDYHDLELLHRPDGGPRDLTAVLGLACISATGGPTSLYLDDLTITCDNLPDPILVDPSGLGLVDLDTAPSQNLDAYLFAASISRGGDGASSAAFWNVALGLDETTFTTAGPCRLTTLATASRTPFPTDSEGSLLPRHRLARHRLGRPPLRHRPRLHRRPPRRPREPRHHLLPRLPLPRPQPARLGHLPPPPPLPPRRRLRHRLLRHPPHPRAAPDPEPPAAPDPVTFSNTATGKAGSLQSWTVPATGSYRLEAWGAQGGNPRGGKGAYVAGDFDLTQGQVLSIGVGQMGSTADTTGTTTADGGGGGGASWVYIKSPITLFLVAGGGGGGGHGGRSGGPGLTGTSGGGALGTGGTNGGGGQNGGGNAYAGAGGAGWNGAGHAAYWSTATTIAGSGGNTIRSSATGGTGTTNNGTVTHGDGGYGGGGAAVHTSGATRGGGGGGYSGGDGAPNATGGMAGGGGGSFNAGTNTTAQSGARTGHGQVVISPNW